MHYKTRKFYRLFHSHEMHLLALLGLFTPEMIDFPPISFNLTSEIPALSCTWSLKRYPFRTRPPHIGHCKEYPRDHVEVLNVRFSFVVLKWVCLMCLLTLDHLQDQDVVFIYNSNRYNNRCLIWKYQIHKQAINRSPVINYSWLCTWLWLSHASGSAKKGV